MKHIIFYCNMFLCALLLTACISNPVRQVSEPFDATAFNIEQQISQPTKTGIAALEQNKVYLLLENERLKQEIQEKQRQIEENHKQIQIIQKHLEFEQQRQLQAWANWIAGVSLVFGVIAFIASLFIRSYPLLPRLLRYAGTALIALAATAFAFSLFVPYVLPITIAIVSIMVCAGIYFWAKDRKSLRQVVEAVELYKNEIPNYKHKFREVIDSDVDAFVEHLREHIKNKH